MLRAFLLVVALLMIGCGQAPAPPEAKRSAPPAAAPVKINFFYASSVSVEKGRPVTLCYGVENAVSVRLEPPVEKLNPGYNRCFQVTPTETTTYRFVAEDAGGSTVSQSVSVTVAVKAASKAAVPPAPVSSLITMFLATTPEISAGSPVMLCYSAPDATAVSISPPVMALEPARRRCFKAAPPSTTTYTLSARARDGHVETESVTVTVK